MKNLEVLDVQEMNAIEMEVLNGGWGWFERVVNCAIKDVGTVVSVMIENIPTRTCDPFN